VKAGDGILVAWLVEINQKKKRRSLRRSKTGRLLIMLAEPLLHAKIRRETDDTLPVIALDEPGHCSRIQGRDIPELRV